jgi:hypothetical protein
MRKFFPLSLLTISFLTTGAWLSSAMSVPARTCEVVARVMKATHEVQKGKAMCANQAIKLSTPVQVSCIPTQQLLLVENTDDLMLCKKEPKVERICSYKNREFCTPGRSEGEANKPVLLQPYGVVILPKPVTFRWTKVTGAERYRVIIEGDNSEPVKLITSNTSLKINPTSGNKTISVIVQASVNNSYVANTVTTFDILSQKTSSEIANYLENTEHFSGSPSEKVLLKLSILTHYGLVDEGISLLSNQISSHSSAQQVRTLANLYLSAGLIKEAKATYEKARSIAFKASDYVEIAKSEERIRLINSWLLQPGA